MGDTANSLPFLDLMIGVVVVAAIVLKAGFERVGLPALVGFLLALLGLLTLVVIAIVSG